MQEPLDIFGVLEAKYQPNQDHRAEASTPRSIQEQKYPINGKDP